MVRVIAPTTALLIFGVFCCKRNCVKCAGSENVGMSSNSFDENVSSGTGTGSSGKADGDNQVTTTSTSNNDFRPPSPAPSMTDSLNYEEDEAELVKMSRSDSFEYDGDCERTPNHLYKTIIEEIPKRLSGISNIFTDQLSKIEGGLERYNEYYKANFEDQEEAENYGHLIELVAAEVDSPDTLDDEGLSSSHSSLVKTRGGSKGSNCNTLRRASGHRTRPSKKRLSIIADTNNSADSCDDFANEAASKQPSDTENVRVNSIENEMAVAPEGSIENQIFNEVYPKVSNGPHCEILDKIDQLASEELQKLSKQIGTFIFEHLWHQITQISPEKPISVAEAYEFFDLLSEIYAQVISIHELSGIRFELCQLIEECLKATLVGDFYKFKPVRDAILLLILNYPNYFDDEFLETVELYETLRTIVHLSDEHEHFDTLEYVRVILSFSNMLDLQQYFDILIKKPQRKPSDDLFLPLMEDNLIKSLSFNSNESKTIDDEDKQRNKAIKNNKKKNTSVQKKKSNLPINHLLWENRIVVLSFGLLLAIIIQCLFLQK